MIVVLPASLPAKPYENSTEICNNHVSTNLELTVYHIQAFLVQAHTLWTIESGSPLEGRLSYFFRGKQMV